MDRQALAASLVSLVEDSAPSRLQFADVPVLLKTWTALKPELIALSAYDDLTDVREAANDLREAGNALFDLVAKEHTHSGLEKKSLHDKATNAAQRLLVAVPGA